MNKFYLLFFLAGIFCFPVPTRAQEVAKNDLNVDLKININTVGNTTGTFGYLVTSGTYLNGSDINFSVNVQNNIGEYHIPVWNSLLNSFYIQQYLPPGWRPVSISCTNTESAGTFSYTIKEIAQTGIVYVNIPRGDNNIVCNFTNQYSQDWLRHSLESDIKIITKTLGGDGVFDYAIESSTWDKSFERYFQINTSSGIGQYYMEALNPSANTFFIKQYLSQDWRPVNVSCTNTETEGRFEYYNLTETITSIYVQVPVGYNRITCTFTVINKNKKTPVLFVPGLLGTNIKKGEELLWANTKMASAGNSDDFMDPLLFNSNLFPIDDSLQLDGVIRKKDFFNIPFYDYTGSLIDEFASKGYVEGKDFFTFPYDWRYGVSGEYPHDLSCSATTTNATLLRDKINELAAISPTGKVDVIAHSMGGLITKKYIIDNDNPKINKLVFVGVPSLGSPDAVQTLLSGSDFKIPGLNTEEIRKISYNMPAAYDLLPGKPYYDLRGSYMGFLTQVGNNSIGYNLFNHEDAQLYFSSRLNPKGLANAQKLHTADFDSYDVRVKVPLAYNIVGCKSGTLPYGVGNAATLPMSAYPYVRISGDDTVPFESADSFIVDNNKVFYIPLANHGQMPSQDGVRQMISAIIAGGPVPAQIVPYIVLKSEPALCQIRGDIIEVHSPLDIFVTEIDNSKNLRLGLDKNGNIIREIPGASFDISNGHKYVYLPQGEGEQYNINLEGSGQGTFTLIRKKIEGDQTISAQVFNDIPVTPDFSGSLEITQATPKIIVDDGKQIDITSQIQGNAANDILSPQTELSINGAVAKEIYGATTTINLTAKDLAQEGIPASGIFSISYRLDNQATTTLVATTTVLAVANEGPHQLLFFATDKLGNKETPKTINFAIDKTSPELKFSFDQTKKDLAFSATDNISLPGKVIITDQGGIVTATDEAGNTVQLKFKETNRKSALRAQLATIAYNGKSVDIFGSQLALVWFYGYIPKTSSLTGLQSLPLIPKILPNTGSLSFLLQQAKFQDGSFIVATYTAGKTAILEYKDKHFNLTKVPGLKIVTFGTWKGGVEWGW